MEIIILLILLLFSFGIIGIVGLSVIALTRWVTKPNSPPPVVERRESDLTVFERQLIRFYREGKINDDVYELLLSRIRAEREPVFKPPTTTKPPEPAVPKSVVIDIERERPPEPIPAPAYSRPQPPPPPRQPPPPPRRPFSEVLNSFMEESNIRWGEIIGGLLIIGCSTALVVSLWAQISQIPVLKFLIFTTVTAILFGVGLYTEHRWKLPTTSRGILTIATLLVPLNFLAIAAVSASNTPGALALGSELAAPAIFLCLVYFAGRVITPGCAHILAAGVLGSSIGQLLVRHFAAPDASPVLLILLAAFPVACYIVTVGMALRMVLSDREIDATETGTVFTVLGTMSFAALLPFGLLLYKSGPLSLTMMYLAPIVTLWGLPMLATGTVLWRRIKNKELVASRTTGTALGILGLMIVLSGMVLSWPNPASIVPAALLNFAIFTALAIALRLPVAHLIAANCLALAYLIVFHVLAGHVAWRNLRVSSLVEVVLSLPTAQALVGAFVIFLIVNEWLGKKKFVRDSYYYLVAACEIAVLNLALLALFGFWTSDNDWLWVVLTIYALGGFWITWRRNQQAFAWIASTVLLFAFADVFSRTLAFSFPWQTAWLTHATICIAAAIFISTRFRHAEILVKPLNYSALFAVLLGVVALFQANTWEVTAMQAQRVFWIAGILLLLLWLNRRRLILNAFEVALLCAIVLTVKASLQEFAWYSYVPLAFLRPAALQIYGTVLALFCLAWIGLRFVVKRAIEKTGDTPQNVWLHDAARLLDTDYSIDRLLSGLLLGAFMLFAVYGALSGLTRELLALGAGYAGLNIAGFAHQETIALGSWVLLGLLTVLMLTNYAERRREEYLLAALVLLSAAIPLLAGRFEPQMATAAAWRWLAAFFLLAGSLVLWYRRDGTATMRRLLIALTVAPLLLFTLVPALRAIYYLPVQSPVAGIFAWFSDDVLYGGPLLLVALVMIGYAVRERIPDYGVYGGFLINLTVTLAFMLAVVSGKGLMDRVVLVRLAQLNAITFAVYALPWLSTRRLWQQKLDQQGQKLADKLFGVQVWLAIGLNVVLIAPVALGLIVEPEPPGIGTIATGTLLGWLTLAATVIAAAWLSRTHARRPSAEMLAGGLMAVSCLIAFTVADINGWLGLHVMTVCVTASAWLMLLAAESDALWQRRGRQLAAVIGVIAAFLSLRTSVDTDANGWWSVGPLLALSVLFAALNWQTLRRRYIYAAGMLIPFAALIGCLCFLPFSLRDATFAIIIIANCMAAIALLWLELRARRLGDLKNPRSTALSSHNLSAIGWPLLLAFLVAVSPGFGRHHSPIATMPVLHWVAWLATVALMAAVLWDKHAKYAVAGLYVLGLLAAGMVLYQLDLSRNTLRWSTLIFLAIYVLATSIVWHWRERIIIFAERYGVPRRLAPDATQLTWLWTFTIAVTTVVVLFAYWLTLNLQQFGLRATAALAVVAQFVTFALFAERAWKREWQQVAILLLVVGLTFFGWSWLTPWITGTWLNRSVILMLLAFGLVALYGLLLKEVKARAPDWTSAAQSCVPVLLIAGAVALFFCLGTEISYQLNFGIVRIHPVALTAIGLTLLAAVVIPVLFALSPQHDPLSLSEKGRMKYVYAAEVMLALLFLHIRLTLPWLFTGFLERYWPLVIMAIAYLGVVTSESLRRRKLLVLAQPLERTGVFLPLLPVLGFWLASSEVDFSLLLFVVGGLYGLLSILRRSFVFGLMAAIAGNGGLWYILHRTDNYQFLQHPQLWLIPIALSALLAAYLNEEDLTEDQMAGIRYLSLVTIYVSSTADIFINGVANSPWLPLILGSFSLAGVFSGIIFRIRGLLLLGSVFLLLSIVTMIWYASANLGWTWLWYVAGIVTGATIIFMFAVFEKKRSEVLRLVEGLKEWER
ncbi:MAG TPA: hypothetical protein VFY61_18285 [Pyrinomonadaceae bacterium]|nr:hypothetical protein [Pyrinomonadaceae bacterium]